MKKDETFLNVWDYVSDRFPFQFFVGARGYGKTYSGLREAVNLNKTNDEKFLYMRRTLDEVKLLYDIDNGSDGLNPFQPLNRDFDWNIGIKKQGEKHGIICDREIDDSGKCEYTHGYGDVLALSSIATMRGLNANEITTAIYDEFIPEQHVRQLKNEGDALWNAYETINRNREFFKQKPLRLFGLSNSNNIYNAVFVSLGVVADVEKMLAKGREHLYIPERGLAVHVMRTSKAFKEKKDATALYRLTKGTSFYDMALESTFAYNDFSLIAHRSIKGYQPICGINNAYIYKKKGSNEFHVSYAKAKCPHYDTRNLNEAKLFLRRFGNNLVYRFTEGVLTFESFELKQMILDIIL